MARLFHSAFPGVHLRGALRLALLVLIGAGISSTTFAQAQTLPNFGIARPLEDVLDNMEGAPWSAVNMAAKQQAQGTLGPKHRNIPASLPFYAAFEGTFIPAASTTRLAVFSDDGCNVYLDGLLVHSALNRGQHLPAINQSLHPIAEELVAGRPYQVRVEYSNIIYSGTTDADGATLFAYTYDENQDRPFAEWRAGNPINCGGMRWPRAGSSIQAGTEGKLSAFLATDFDQRDVTFEGETRTLVLSDPCSYTWEASGGSFKGGRNTGQAVTWIAPTQTGTYTLRLRVDDQNMANQPTYESGQRVDVPRSFNDAPLLFSVTVNVVSHPVPQW